MNGRCEEGHKTITGRAGRGDYHTLVELTTMLSLVSLLSLKKVMYVLRQRDWSPARSVNDWYGGTVASLGPTDLKDTNVQVHEEVRRILLSHIPMTDCGRITQG